MFLTCWPWPRSDPCWPIALTAEGWWSEDAPVDPDRAPRPPQSPPRPGAKRLCLQAWVDLRGLGLLRTVLLSPVDWAGVEQARWRCPRRRPRRWLRRLRSPRIVGRVRNERSGIRRHVWHLLQAEDRKDL